MTTNLKYKDEAREKLMTGAGKVAEAVISTLGPQGRNVTIQRERGKLPIITKDGVTVAESIKSLECPWEDTGAQIIKQAARSTAIAAGDGTTTSTLLTYELMKSGMVAIQNGANPVDVKKGMEISAQIVIERVKQAASSIGLTSEMLLGIATISANNDSEIGALVHEAVEAVGLDGLITIDYSKTNKTHVSKSNGMEVDMGYIDPAFINNPKGNNIEFLNPLIFLYPKKISLLKEVEESMILAKHANRPVVFICDGMDSEALVTLRRNKLEMGYPVAVVKLPGFGSTQREQLEDIAIALGGTVIGAETGISPDKIQLKHFGSCDAIVISREKTSILGWKGKEGEINTRIAQIKNFIESADSSKYEKKLLEKRVARLCGKMATIHIGAPTEIEVDEKRYRIDDAVCAARAALEAGVVPGGGTMYYKIARGFGDTAALGEAQIVQAIQQVYLKILSNSGETERPHESPEYHSHLHMGWNAKSGKIEDLVAAGILDPAKVLICALENAVSTASMLLLTECSIVES